MVFYRKYRPQKINELDSEEIREKLSNILLAKEVPHAFLFSGPKGLGKTSTARILAKAVNCEKNSKFKTQSSKVQVKTQKSKTEDEEKSSDRTIEPCNKCSQCTSITNGTNLDVLEIDGASNRGIDEIRDLREKIRLLPVSASKKIYIIDEVHMLTTEAFNALLKTLEEPPSHAIFILCTTEAHKIPATILSRCFNLNFKLATEKELLRSFNRITKDEKLPIESEALEFLATLSDGSFRDGVKILEELVLASDGKKITKEIVEQKYHTTSIKNQLEQMIDCFVQKDAKKGLHLVSKLTKQGTDIKYFIQQIIDVLHNELLVKAGVEDNSKFNPSTKLRTRVQSAKLTMEEIKKLIELLTKAYGDIRLSVLEQLPLEMAIIEWGMEGQEDALRSVELADPGQSQALQLHTPGVCEGAAVNSVNSSEELSHAKATRASQDNVMNDLIEKVKVYNHSLAGVLRGCSLKKFDGKKFIIETRYKFHKEKLEEKKAIEILEKVVEEIVGEKVEVSILLKNPA